MPREYGRNRRVADLIQRELAMLLERERSGKDAAMLTISKVDVSPDLKNAKIYVTSLDEVANESSLIKELNHNSPAFRHHLANSLKLRGVPSIKFFYDHNLERANRVTSLLDQISQEDAAPDDQSH